MKAYVSMPQNANFPTFFTEENLALAASLGEFTFCESPVECSNEEVAKQIGDADVYITAWDSPRLDKTILDAAPNLKLMVHLCGTVAPFVTDEVFDRGVRVISGNDMFAESVAEGTVGYILAALRNIPKFSHRYKYDKIWRAPGDFNRGLLGKTVGLVSYGAIAKHLVRMLQPFRVKIKVYDIKPLPEEDKRKYGLEEASLEEVFSTSDIVSLHTPLYEKTYHMIGEELLSKIKDGALFINTSRGKIVDQPALERELAKARFNALLDVYEVEPLPDDNPMREMDNVILMPHMGGPTVDFREDITRTLLLESAAFMRGEGELVHEVSHAQASVMTREEPLKK